MKLNMKFLSVMAIALIFSGCSTDNRERIAMATLYPDNGPVLVVSPAVRDYSPYNPAPILSAALNERFPPGTDVEELKRYVAQFDGRCDESQQEQLMKCWFIETGTFCAQTDVLLTVKTTPLNRIGHIVANREHNVC